MKELSKEMKFSGPDVSIEEMDSFYKIDEKEIPIDRPYIWSMFVETADGIVSFLEPEHPNEDIGLLGAGIAGRHFGNEGAEIDWRLLQHGWSVADAIVAGSGILKAKPSITWLPIDEDLLSIHKKKLSERKPLRVVITGKGFSREELEKFIVLKDSPDFDTLVAVTEKGIFSMEKNLQDLGLTDKFVTFGKDSVDMVSLVKSLREDYKVRFLDLQGGPNVVGQFLKNGLVDEYRLTVSPLIAGSKSSSDKKRPTPVETHFTPEEARNLEMTGLKEFDSYLFLRYKVLRKK